ncbi:hypothetical protein [Rhodococcus sovatensis]|uniref:Uncharacterized protein n=1 Tax=Rhodococcus sovatensis TaxID=1805840 RepID=A0ABZ2PSW5_9NOCA
MSTNGGPSWFRRLFARSKSAPLDPARSDLVVVASSFDDAESASSALERAASTGGWNSEAETVFRHHLVLPAETVEDAASIASQDRYEVAEGSWPKPEVPAAGYRMNVVDGVEVTLQRVQVIDALHISQERSRMAGLAQRRGGVVVGWDALQPDAAST